MPLTVSMGSTQHLSRHIFLPEITTESLVQAMEHPAQIMEPPAMAIKHLATIIKLPSRLTIVPKQPTTLHSPPITHPLLPPSQSRTSIITTITLTLLTSQEKTIKWKETQKQVLSPWKVSPHPSLREAPSDSQ